MVSGSDVPKYKSKKTGYFQPTNNGNFKRFSSGNEPMRPWPPMYHDRDTRMADSKMYMVDHKNMKNNYKNSMYDSSEYNYYQNNRKLINGAAHGPDMMNGMNGKSTKNGHSQHNFGIKNPVTPIFNGRDDNLLMIANRDKYQLRKLRNPTQTSSSSSQSRTCPCTRSKSMEDIRASIVVERPTSYKESFVEHKLSPNNGKNLDKTKHSTRRSMDNLLRVDTNFGRHFQVTSQNDPSRPRFVAVTALEDVQAVRCAEFHPNGQVYSVGSNSKTFRICEYPSLSEVREDHTTFQPTVLFKRTKHHKGSIYCMAWSPQGDLVATGSNDKTVKLMRYNEVLKQLEGKETELTMHDGTVRDLCFLEDSTNKTSLLISGGAGDCKVYVTDCATATPFQALSGHGGHILSLYNWGGAMFVSGSQDKSVRFWDLRTRGCVNTVTPATVPGSRQGSPVAAVSVDPSGRLLVSGHEDSSCVLYDIRGNRPIQCFKPHASDIRSIRFSPSAYYLLTGGYDNKLVLTDLQGDLTMPLPSVVVAQHSDKVISGRWHPTDFSFLSTSADKTATLWALPPI